METQQKNKIRGWEAEEKQENTKQQQQQQSKESVSSAPSSPSHEFSFTVSLLSSSTTNNNAKSQQKQPPLAIDLTPADDIFFHGHLLPLHLLQNPPASPRSSTNSLPIRELLAGEVKPHNIHSCICRNCTDTRPKRHSFNSYEYTTRRSYYDHTNRNADADGDEEEEFPAKERVKSKSFSLFGRPRRRKQGDSRCEDQNKKKARFDHVSHFLRKYIALLSKGRIRTEDILFTKQPCSFSGKVLVAASRVPPPPSSDSTMEELQAAIQAAIAHCKNSIAVAEKLNS